MSIEDRSLDASKEEGTATVIDGSDHGWNRSAGPVLLHSESGAGKGYLRVVSNESLRADGDKDNSDHYTRFTVHNIDSNDGRQFVILEHYKPKKVVAIDANKNDVIMKGISSETFKGFTNLDVVENDHPDILFQKIPREESALFYLKPYRDDTQMVGFNSKGDPIVRTADPGSNNHKFLFKICNEG